MLLIDSLELSIGEAKILRGLSLSVAAGETIGVIGPNGSGKTSLFNTLSGFTPLNAGSICFRGEEITEYTAHARALRGIGRVFQNFGIFREMTVEQNILIALEGRQSALANFLPWSNSSRQNRQRALEYLGQVGLEDRAVKRAGSLSGGQMRLLEIIRTLAFGAELFLLDEPTAGVSPIMKKQVAQIILRLKELGKTIMVIEHDLNFVQQFCSRIIVIDCGQVVMDGTPEEIRNSPLLADIYFGSSGNETSHVS